MDLVVDPGIVLALFPGRSIVVALEGLLIFEAGTEVQLAAAIPAVTVPL